MVPNIDCQDYGWGCGSDFEGGDVEFANDAPFESMVFTVSWTKEVDGERKLDLGPAFKSERYGTLDIKFSEASGVGP